MWLISDMVLTLNGSFLLFRYLPLLRCIFGKGMCPIEVVLFVISFYMNSCPILLYLNYILHYIYVAYFVHILEIFVNM